MSHEMATIISYKVEPITLTWKEGWEDYPYLIVCSTAHIASPTGRTTGRERVYIHHQWAPKQHPHWKNIYN